MIGAIAGDMIGSLYESNPIKHTDFYLYVAAFTDDTVLTIAIANAILNDSDNVKDKLPCDLRKILEKFNYKYICAY